MRSIVIILLTIVSLLSYGQYYYYQEDYNPIYTAADYLELPSDGRSVGLGQAGVASTPDVFSMHWNPAKYSFTEDLFGISVSYTDIIWMKKIWNNNNVYGFNYSSPMGFNSLHSYCKIKERSSLAMSFTYFVLSDNVTLIDELGNDIGTYKPLDLSFDLAYSYRFSDNLSAALAGRYIFSRMIQGQFVQGGETMNANSVAFDLAVYYQKALQLGSRDGEIRLGADISNIGTKVSYTTSPDKKKFLPTNLRLGAGFTYRFNDDHSLSFQFDANKLLVPTPPIYKRDSLGLPVYDDEGNPVIAEGMDPDVSVPKGMIQSWYDAPCGFEEEWHEWSFGGGFEYRYKTYFSARTGIFYQDKSKGQKRYYNAGAGFKIGVFGMDFGIMVPLEDNIWDHYLSLFYFRTSATVTIR